jgi:hypothetical protein
MHRIILACLVPSLAVMAGCAAPSGTPSAPAGTRFDGVYEGRSELLRGVAFQCGQPDLPDRSIVRDGRFDFPFQVDPPRTTPIPVQIAADGSFEGSIQYGTVDYSRFSNYRNEWATVTGRITGDVLDATETDYRCARRSVLQRR